ncbi:MAG: biotin--[acetyl-CoA-carboxylase] ligase [Methylocystis sp.]|nr:biotin--[acetyl-CoA-carboxylase] ligase [Methylocystis sp.]
MARSHGVRLAVYDELDSTNDEAKCLVNAGETGPLWVVAARQSNGRGRLGRTWVSPPGNLHASLILSDFGPERIAPQLGFVAGVATMSALCAATGAGERLALKWPNDILLDGAKAGGILLEAAQRPTSSDAFACVIGVGVNCRCAPQGLAGPVSDLTALGAAAPSAPELFAHLADAMIDALELWAQGDRFASVRERWLAHAAGLARPIRVALGRETIAGRFETIDAAGRLVLSTDLGTRVIEAGDVFLPDVTTPSDARAPLERSR